jgi:hypothetical protein
LCGSARRDHAGEPEFRKLADDVFAYIGKVNDANALIVVTSQGVVVIDTGNNQPETRNILKTSSRDQAAGAMSSSRRTTAITSAARRGFRRPRRSSSTTAWQRIEELEAALVKARRNVFERQEALKDFNPMDAVVTSTIA